MNRALFLDRDGVINIEKEYLYRVEDVEFCDGIFELCRVYADLGYKIVVVTNQSGIARGFYSEEDLDILSVWMAREFESRGVVIDKTYYCPHLPSISGECECRKPKAGMLYKAAKELDIDLSNSIIIGDKERDVEAGFRAGLKECYLLSNRVYKSAKNIQSLRDLI